MGKVTQFWKLDNPEHCRAFLRDLRIGPDGLKIEFLTQSDGKEIALADASDEQVVQIANELAGGAPHA